MKESQSRSAPPESPDLITEISLEREGCLGPCPVYSMTLRSDGTALYCGRYFVPREGQFAGVMPKAEFRRLAALVFNHGFFALDERYFKPVTDLASVITTVTAGEYKKVVDNYGRYGPHRLELLEKAIDRAAARIEWTTIPDDISF
ncbi:MAG: DUF6438 domain-containing protein [Gemmatimonadaceae bacterium]